MTAFPPPDRWNAVRAAAGLRHPNIVPVQDASWDAETAFVAMAPVDGEALATMLARVGRLPFFQGLALAAQLLAALDHAHGQGVVHTALDAGQLLVTRGGRLQVAGFACVALQAAVAQQAGTAEAGACAAPEQILGEPVDHRADLYAAAVIAYELLTGSPPFPPGPVGAAAARPAWPARAARPELPAGIDAVFLRALAQDPARRYGSAAELLAALLAAAGKPLWAASSAAAGRDRPGTARRRRRSAGTNAFRPRPRQVAWATACIAALLVAAGLAERTADRSHPAQLQAPPQEARSRLPPAAARSEALLAAAAPARQSAPPPAAPSRGPAATDHDAAAAAAEPTRGDPVAGSRPAATTSVPSHTVARPAAHPAGAAPQARAVSAPRAARGASARTLDCRQDTAFARNFCAAWRCATAEFRHHPVCVGMHADAVARYQLAEPRDGP